MKKLLLSFTSIIIIACILFSCKQQKSLQELIQEERKAIDRFISMNDLVILKEYPKDGVFKENEYFKTTEGMFFQVVDSGNGNKVRERNDVSIRYEYMRYIKDAVQGKDEPWYPGDPYQPLSFLYINRNNFIPYDNLICEAWVIPLSYVGEFAILNMIVPSSLGSSGDRNNISPVFYKNLRYTRFN